MSRMRIWIPEIRPSNIQSVPVNVELSYMLQGYFTTELLDKDGNVVKSMRFPNVLTNSYMDGIGSGTFGVTGLTAALSRLRAGTGSAIPSGTDTNLQAPIGNFVTADGGFDDDFGFVSGSGPSGSYHYLIRSRLFDFNDAVGNISELAWFSSTSGVALVRSLVRDQFGTPTFIIKTNQEQLRVRYELRMIVPTQSSSFMLVVGTTSHSVSLYPNNIDENFIGSTNWNFIFRNFGGSTWTSIGAQPRLNAYSTFSLTNPWNPTGSISIANRALNDTQATSSYTTGTYFRETSHSFAATNVTVNAYPSGIFMIGATPALNQTPSNPNEHTPPWMMSFNPPIQKSDIQRLDLFVRWSWSRSGTESR